VKSRLRSVLEVGPSPTILSLCSGDGRDVIESLADYPLPTARAVLVEIDEELSERAKKSAEAHRLSNVEVRCADAGEVESFLDVIPVDVLLLCGIFGNIDHSTVRTIVPSLPLMVTVGGYVIWTRGGSAPDRRPEIRNWFVQAGLEEVAFDGAPEPFGVGLNRMTAPPSQDQRLPDRLFSFKAG
jgi:hypothetical protein